MSLRANYEMIFVSTKGKSPKGFSEINCSFNKLLMATKGLVKNLFVFCASLFCS